jgi:uncharacterized OsmC-like protein
MNFFHIIITVHLHESNETKLDQLMHKLSHLYCSVLLILYTAYTKEWCGFNRVHY